MEGWRVRLPDRQTIGKYSARAIPIIPAAILAHSILTPAIQPAEAAKPPEIPVAALTTGWPNEKFSVAGSVVPAIPAYHYWWGELMPAIPASQKFSAPNHDFAWMAAKMDGRDFDPGSECVVCTDADVDRIYNDEVPKIQRLLENPINRGGTWIIGNEADWIWTYDPNRPHWWSVPPEVHSRQFRKYRTLIKSLDPSAKLLPSSMAIVPGTILDRNDAQTFMDRFFAATPPSERPDIYNVHYYIYPSRLQEGLSDIRWWRSYINSKDPGKPTWVTEFAGAGVRNISEQMSMMDYIIDVYDEQGGPDGYQKWFWYLGQMIEGAELNALYDTDTGQLRPLGRHYRDLAITYAQRPERIPTATPTITPTRTITPTVTPTLTLKPPETPQLIFPTPFPRAECNPRPPVLIQSEGMGDWLKVTIRAGLAPLGDSHGVPAYSVRSNVNGVLTELPGATPDKRILRLTRVIAGRPTTVGLEINDGCGAWWTFIGGGINAGF